MDKQEEGWGEERKEASKEGREREREREREDPPTSHTSSNMLSVFCTREFVGQGEPTTPIHPSMLVPSPSFLSEAPLLLYYLVVAIILSPK